MNLMKSIQKMRCTCIQRMNLLWKRNKAVLNDLLGNLYTTEANDKIPDNCKNPSATAQAAENQKQTNSGGLAKCHNLLYVSPEDI